MNSIDSSIIVDCTFTIMPSVLIYIKMLLTIIILISMIYTAPVLSNKKYKYSKEKEVANNMLVFIFYFFEEKEDCTEINYDEKKNNNIKSKHHGWYIMMRTITIIIKKYSWEDPDPMAELVDQINQVVDPYYVGVIISICIFFTKFIINIIIVELRENDNGDENKNDNEDGFSES